MRNPVKEINDYFGVSDLTKIVDTEKFKAICPNEAISFHVNIEESGMTYLWFEDYNGFTGYGLDNGELKLYKSRASIFLNGCNSLKQRHSSLREVVRTQARTNRELIKRIEFISNESRRIVMRHAQDKSISLVDYLLQVVERNEEIISKLKP